MGDYWDRQDALCSLIERGADWPHELIGYALPTLAGGLPPTPLLLWWALLHGLSSLARYEPARWTAALNIDASPIAWSLERALDLAETVLPGRILDALATP